MLRRTTLSVWMSLFALAILSTPLLAQDSAAKDAADTKQKKKPLTGKDLAAAGKALAPSMILVEYTLQYDAKGQAPYCAGTMLGAGYLANYIKEQRPLELAGYALTQNSVIVPDLMIHPRFVKAIHVTAGLGKKRYPAEVVSFGKKQFATILRLTGDAKPLTPLAFNPKAKKPYIDVQREIMNARWTTQIQPFSCPVILAAGRPDLGIVSPYVLITDRTGTPVGMSMNTELPLDDTWKKSPAAWDLVSLPKLTKTLAATQTLTDNALLRVTLHFRSPKKAGIESMMSAGPSELQTLGLRLNAKQLVILANLPPKLTARLDRIVAHFGKTKTPATFQHTLKDYGAIVATLADDAPKTAPMTLSKKNVLDYENLLLPAIEVGIQGETKITYAQHLRITSYDLGWKRHVYPETSFAGGDTFLFDEAGHLLALPITRKDRANPKESQKKLTASIDLHIVLGDLKNQIDPSNTPLTEEEENRLAWLGVLMQPLNPQLARANKVSDLTRNGKTGALVQYVYPASPAAKAGVEPGWILLRIHWADQPKPIDLRYHPGAYWGTIARGRPFPWKQLDNLPEAQFDKIPRPWAPAEDSLARMLTNQGFGKKFTAEFFADGKVVKKDFTVTMSPKHFDTAASAKSPALGMTVKNLTFETQRFFRRTPETGGVIISHIDLGSLASTSGLKPFEIIESINDKPVKNVKDFETLTAQGGELRLAIKRWTMGRVVTVTVDAPKGKTPKAPADPK